jgi:hypothetical protein
LLIAVLVRVALAHIRATVGDVVATAFLIPGLTEDVLISVVGFRGELFEVAVPFGEPGSLTRKVGGCAQEVADVLFQFFVEREGRLRFGLRGDGIRPGATDGREDIFENQFLKTDSIFGFGFRDKTEDVGFRENAHILFSSECIGDGVLFQHPTAVVSHRAVGVFESKSLAYIRSNKEYFSVVVDDSDFCLVK